MNIFVLDKNPKKAAKYHCDKHVVKMILETAQILCSVRYLYGLDAPYKPTHLKHPCVLWAKESRSNYDWLLNLGFELVDEYNKRYNKKHKCEEVLIYLKENKKSIPFKKNHPTEFQQCMPEKYRVSGDPVQAYRKFYIHEKAKFATWKNEHNPEWFKTQKID